MLFPFGILSKSVATFCAKDRRLQGFLHLFAFYFMPHLPHRSLTIHFSFSPQKQSVNENGTAAFICFLGIQVDCRIYTIFWKRQVIALIKLSRCVEIENNLLAHERYSVYLNSADNLQLAVISNVTPAQFSRLLGILPHQ